MTLVLLHHAKQLLSDSATVIRFDTITGWAWPEIALLYSIELFTYAIGAPFTFVQMREIESHVRSGIFETVLKIIYDPGFA